MFNEDGRKRSAPFDGWRTDGERDASASFTARKEAQYAMKRTHISIYRRGRKKQVDKSCVLKTLHM